MNNMKLFRYILPFLTFIVLFSSCSTDNEIVQSCEIDLNTISNQIKQVNGLLTNLESAKYEVDALIESMDSLGLSQELYCKDFVLSRGNYVKNLNTVQVSVQENQSTPEKWVASSKQIAQQFIVIQGNLGAFKNNIYDIETYNVLTRSSSNLDLSGLISSLSEVLDSLQNQIDEIKQELESLQGEVNTLRDEVREIINSVQSITVVPDFTDGSVGAAKSPYSLIRFEVLPNTAASRIVSIGTSAFSIDGVSVTRVAAKSAGALKNYPVGCISYDGDFVCLLVNFSDLDLDSEGVNVRLKITDGVSIKGSEFFKLKKVSSNLFNKQIAEAGVHIKTYPYGSIAPAYNSLDKYGVSSYIPVKGQDIITNSRIGNNVGSINVYDHNKTYLRTIYNNQQYTYLEGDGFIRVAYYPFQIGQANYGHTLLPYEDYYVPTTSTSDKEETLWDIAVRRYGGPALSWVDDDFLYWDSNYSKTYDAVYNWSIANNIRFDIGYIPDVRFTKTFYRVVKVQEWKDAGFGFLLHPTHTGWFDEPNRGYYRNDSIIEEHLTNGICKFEEYEWGTPKIIIYPGNSHVFDSTIDIAKRYVECGFCWDSRLYSNHLVENERYRLRRMDIQLCATETKTQIKNAIKTAIDNGDWVILGSHIYHYEVSDVLDETSRTTANLFDIVSYANNLCKMRLCSDVWSERKILFEIANK